MTNVFDRIILVSDNHDMLDMGRDYKIETLFSGPVVSNWPCNPEKTIVAHIPDRNSIVSSADLNVSPVFS